ncbi:Protein CBG27492 [Caenorhabditis briggsae]|uniref:Protein CBG27492 n=1 Tax=Caenorhabditis briggsae TaxID=6238 RepID=B6IF07_CAEBR|nr:Protein CBG27492 [Caenorhabditis briggsae]CAR98487.1 Protein CBG27492 [Caenorhabditis briggsae]
MLKKSTHPMSSSSIRMSWTRSENSFRFLGQPKCRHGFFFENGNGGIVLRVLQRTLSDFDEESETNE